MLTKHENIQALQEALKKLPRPKNEYMEASLIEQISGLAATNNLELKTLNQATLNSLINEIDSRRASYNGAFNVDNAAKIIYYDILKDKEASAELSSTAAFKKKYQNVVEQIEPKMEPKNEIFMCAQPATASTRLDIFQTMKDLYEEYRREQLPEQQEGLYPKEITMGDKKGFEFKFDSPEGAAEFFTMLATKSQTNLNVIDPETHKVIAHIHKDGRITQDGPEGKLIESPQDLAKLLREKDTTLDKKTSESSEDLANHEQRRSISAP